VSTLAITLVTGLGIISGASLAQVAADTGSAISEITVGEAARTKLAQAQTPPGAKPAPPPAAPAASAKPANNASEEVVVVGFRNSLERALNAKRTAAVALDSILAEDIGKFPELNLAESVQRIPGVAITRDGGEGRQISVRGLGPQFTRIRINGLEALTTTGGPDASGGVNRNRAFDFNIFSADLFKNITVRKTQSADTQEGSLGATVDLRTARPFDYDGFKLVATAKGSYNDLSETASPRGSILVSNTWDNDRFGALFSVAYTKRELQDNGTSTVRWATGNAFAPGFASAPAGFTLAQINGAYHPRFPRFDDYQEEQERVGLSGALQWRPVARALLSFDALYSNFKGTREERYLEAPSFSVGGACAANAARTCGINQTNVTSARIDSNNTLIAGTFNNVDLRVEDRYDELETTFSQYALSGEYAFTDKLKADFLLGTSKSEFKNPIQTTLTMDQFNVQNYAYDYSVGRVPLLNYGSANLTDPASWVLTGIRLRPQTATNSYDGGQFNLGYDALDWLSVRAGYDYKRYSFVTTSLRRSNGTSTNQEAVVPAGILALPLSSYTTLENFNGNGLNMPAGSTTRWLVPNLATATGLLSLNDPTAYGGAFRLGPEPDLGNNRRVRETDSGEYFQADIKTSVAGFPLRGNIGVRIVDTDMTSSGYTFLTGAAVPITVNKKYQDTLPSLNLALELRDDLLLRFGASKVMTRPDLGSLSPGASLSVSGSSRSVTVGNPNLDPFRANSYDVAVEWSLARGGLASVALFKKDIGSLVQTLTVNGPFTGNPFGLPDSLAIAACGATVGCSPSSSWNFSAPINSKGGTVKGFELNYQQPFRFLPGLLENTGVITTYTYASSRIGYLNSAGVVTATRDLTGLSRNAYSATGYYEDEKVSLRFSAAYRQKYLTRVPGQEAGTDFDGTNGTLNFDASFQYTLNDHLKLTVEGINLTDEVQDQFNDSSNRVSYYHHTGREFLVGMQYRF
jgi:TonB-dependent receptor